MKTPVYIITTEEINVRLERARKEGDKVMTVTCEDALTDDQDALLVLITEKIKEDDWWPAGRSS